MDGSPLPLGGRRLALALIGVSGVAMLLRSDETLTLVDSWGRTMAALVLRVGRLVGDAGDDHVLRSPEPARAHVAPMLTDEERKAASEQVRRAIARMDKLLRVWISSSRCSLACSVQGCTRGRL